MRRFTVDVGDGNLAGIAFGDENRTVDSLFVHANGFNAHTYQSILEPLGLRAHVAGIDLRGHGRSTAPANPKKQTGWNVYRDDLIKVLEAVAPNGTVLAGHSMGATTSLLAAAKRPDLVQGLVLVDPVLLPAPTYRWAHLPAFPSLLKRTTPMAKGARRRRNQFDSQEHAIEKLTGRGAFKTWRKPFLEDYVADGVLFNEETDSWHLACHPEWEAANFGGQRHRPWTALKNIECPIILIRAEKGSTCPRSSASRFRRIKPETYFIDAAGTTHFVPMERPYVVRDAISQFLSRLVEGFKAGEVGRVQRNLDSKIGLKD